MIECYYKQCMYHCKTEPFCTKDQCKATDEQLHDLKEWRTIELKNWKKND
jgi:hypothetical protein